MLEYKTIFIAGWGSIASGIFRVGEKFLSGFKNIVVVDRQKRKSYYFRKNNIDFHCINIENLSYFKKIIKKYDSPYIFINLCSNTDNYRIRKFLSNYFAHSALYIDTCCSGIYKNKENRFSKLMPYTFKKCNNKLPYFICGGINPGMVEIIARMIIKRFLEGGKEYDIYIFEKDELTTKMANNKIAVSWSPEILINEVVYTPTFQIINGSIVEEKKAPTIIKNVRWGNKVIESRIVGHEEIWNFFKNNKINNSFFSYSLPDKVMNLFKNSYKNYYKILKVPNNKNKIFGKERIAVKVINKKNNKSKTLIWEEDHHKIWKKYKINAVQYQTTLSIIFFIELLKKIKTDKRDWLYCASNFPINHFSWKYINKLMRKYRIKWKNGDNLNLSIV